jgi:hypothetical protein
MKKINNNNSIENKHINPKLIKSYSKHTNKQNLYKKNIIENNKIDILSLSKYINKSNNSIKINNLKTKNCNQLKSQNININKLVNKNESYIYNINNIFVNYDNNNNSILTEKKNIESNRNEPNTGKVGNTLNKIVTDYYYCFPDNKFRIIKGLKKDKLLHYFKKDSHFSNQEIKFINFNYKNSEEANNNIYDSRLIDYFTNVPKEKGKSTNRSVDDKYNNTSIKTFSQPWIILPFQIEKYLFRIVIEKYAPIFFNRLGIINKEKFGYLKQKKLFKMIKNNDIKIIKYYFRIYRDNVLIEKVKLLYRNNYFAQQKEQNNEKIKLRSKDPKKNNRLENKAKLFLTKTVNKKSNFSMENIEKLYKRLKTFIYKFHISNYFFILKKYTPNRYSKSSEKIQKKKKHIKIRYIRKGSDSNFYRSNKVESNKTSSSDISHSTIQSSKKMNIQRRIVFVNNQIKDKEEEKDLKNIMNNITLKYCKKEKKQLFSRWKNLALFNDNNKRKKTLNKRKFLCYFLAYFIYLEKNEKPKNNNKILMGNFMYIWLRRTFL